jgi:hypothetical protein
VKLLADAVDILHNGLDLFDIPIVLGAEDFI